MQSSAVNELAVAVGRKGCGKTTWAAQWVRSHYNAGRRCLVVAPEAGIPLPGSPVIRAAGLEPYSRLRGRSAVVIPDGLEMASNAFNFAWFSQAERSGSLYLVVDEANLFVSYTAPDPTLLKIVQFGRHRRINACLVVQRPASLHNDVLAQADRRVIFHTIEPNDLVYLRKFTGADPESLQSLPPFEFIESNSLGLTRGRVSPIR